MASIFLAGCGAESLDETVPDADSQKLHHVSEVAELAELEEVRSEFESVDSLGNRYMVVVRHDRLTAAEVAAMPGSLRVLSIADASEHGYTEEIASSRVSPAERLTMRRNPGTYVVVPMPIDAAPEAVGIVLTQEFGPVQSQNEPGTVSAQAGYSTCSANVNVYYCGAARSFTCYMQGGLLSTPGENDGVLQARKVNGTCGSSSTSYLNGINYNIQTSGPKYFNVSGYSSPSGQRLCRINPGSEDDCISGDLSLQVWF